jgi:hypothetical protein
VLIVGSGSSFHNFFIREAYVGDSSATFDGWLQHALINAKPAERTQLPIQWEGAPFARAAHPHEDKAAAKAAVSSWLAAGNKSTGDPNVDAMTAEQTQEGTAATVDPVAACYEHLPDDAQISGAERWPKLAAAIVAILGALPWAWYFLLRRVAELRAAIGGKPPSG